jgi:hypothetical protein
VDRQTKAITGIIENAITKKFYGFRKRKNGSEIINQHPPQASKRIWEGIKTIISKE